MARTIEENDCDVVAMQEVDTGRMTSYLVDNAYYLARTLKMQVAYLPTVEHLTGIGILYRGPKVIENTQLLSSLQEQTGIIGLTLGESKNPFHAYGIWMGLSNEDTERQISEALAFIDTQGPASFGGDFNAGSESKIADAIREADFADPFTSLGMIPAPFTSPAIEPLERIDFVWLRGFSATDAWVSESLASDHRMVVVEVKFSP
jgi:endonuclease/exonuclease/phosphatase (EEP) superfamily protein YafD